MAYISYIGASENHFLIGYLPIVFAYVIFIDLGDIQETSCYVVVLIIAEILDINISLKEVNTLPQMHLFPPQQS